MSIVKSSIASVLSILLFSIGAPLASQLGLEPQ